MVTEGRIVGEKKIDSTVMEEVITFVGLTDCIKVGLKLGIFERKDDGMNDAKELGFKIK